MTATLDFLFESTPSGGWVPVLAGTPLVDGPIASQNAGSINRGMYYQVDGSGMNGRFKTALLNAHKVDGQSQLDSVNAYLRMAYNACYGLGSYPKDANASPRTDRLTSFIVPITPDPDGAWIGRNVVAMIYSVGPVLDRSGIVDKDAYAQIYYDALKAVGAWNDGQQDPITALRITMLSCGIYGDMVDDKDGLYLDAAAAIIAGMTRAAIDCTDLPPVKILINTNDSSEPRSPDGTPHVPRERPAFTAAAKALDITADERGFAVPLADSGA
jgi:hypothetical protein